MAITDPAARPARRPASCRRTPVALIVDRHRGATVFSPPLARRRPRASARSGADAAPGRARRAARANSCRAPPSPGTNTRITSSSVAWHSSPAARSASRNAVESPSAVFTRSSKTWPRGCLSAAIGPAAAIASLVHDDDVVAGVFDVGQQVRRHDEVDALVVGEIAHQLQHLVAPLRVHAVGRLVEEQQVGIVHQRLRQLDPLLHAGRVGLDVAIARLAEADVEEHLVRALHGVHARQAGQLAAVRDERDGVHARECARRSPACSRRARGCRAAPPATSRPRTRMRPRSGTMKPEQRLDHRALAGAVRAEQADRARRRTTAVTSCSARLRAVGDGHALERDDRCRLSHSLRVVYEVRRSKGPTRARQMSGDSERCPRQARARRPARA